jgi:membrane-associated HD superfamily phosphohydrolase
MSLSFNDPNLNARILTHIKKKLDATQELRSSVIARHVHEMLVQAYSSPETVSSFHFVQNYLKENNSPESELAPLSEVVSHIAVTDNEIVIDSEDPLVNRTIRSLELFGNAPLKGLKDKLASMGFKSIRGM